MCLNFSVKNQGLFTLGLAITMILLPGIPNCAVKDRHKWYDSIMLKHFFATHVWGLYGYIWNHFEIMWQSAFHIPKNESYVGSKELIIPETCCSNCIVLFLFIWKKCFPICGPSKIFRLAQPFLLNVLILLKWYERVSKVMKVYYYHLYGMNVWCSWGTGSR